MMDFFLGFLIGGWVGALCGVLALALFAFPDEPERDCQP